MYDWIVPFSGQGGTFLAYFLGSESKHRQRRINHTESDLTLVAECALQKDNELEADPHLKTRHPNNGPVCASGAVMAIPSVSV